MYIGFRLQITYSVIYIHVLIARWPFGCPSSASLLLVETIAGDAETQTSSELLATLTAANSLAMIVEDVGWDITSFFMELFANKAFTGGMGGLAKAGAVQGLLHQSGQVSYLPN